MHAILLWTAVLFGAPPADGTLLFLENSNLFVELYTGSETTHVAVVLNDKETSWVYEATPHEVRKLKLDDYYAELGRMNQRRSAKQKIRVTMLQPRTQLPPTETAAVHKFLEQQLQRRYSIKGYVRGESDGIHCAELAARMLCTAGALDIERCQDEYPASVLQKVKPLSRPPANITITEPLDRPNWCTQSWRDCSALTDWCQWSCWEAWSFCW